MSNDENVTAPGVFLEEVPGRPPSIAAAPTSIAAFVGTPSQLPVDDPDAARLITNPADYRRSFGRLDDGSFLALAVRGFFENGGRRAYVVPVDTESLAAAIDQLEIPDDASIIVTPDLMTTLADSDGAVDAAVWSSTQTAVLARCERDRRMYILDPPPKLTPEAVAAWRGDAGFDSAFGALYYPWLTMPSPSDPGSTVDVPPSGSIAGVWARVDVARGVWKAPANEVVNGIVGLAGDVDAAQQDVLNPQGVNAIRALAGRGRRVWGSRTLASDPTMRFIAVRRLAIMIERSVERGLGWAVFEPNAASTWSRVERSVEQFLADLWRSGAFAGTSADEAFFARCDAETNPPSGIEAGVLTVEVGFAPLRPAEFVVVRISQIVRPDGGGSSPPASAALGVTLEVDGTVVDGFTAVSGLGHDTEVIEHRDDGDAATAPSRRRVGRHLPSQIVLTRTLDAHPYLVAWFDDVRDESTATHRRDGSIVLSSADGAELARWNFVNGWPRSSVVSELGTAPFADARETIVLVHEGLTRAI